MEKYYLARNGKTLGPWSISEILNSLQAKTLDWTDYLYDETKKDWVVLMEHPSLSHQFKDRVETVTAVAITGEPRSGQGQPTGRSPEWFVLKGENKYGPFAYLDLVRMLQEKKLFEFDYVWRKEMSSWKRVSEVQEFSPEQMRTLKESGEKSVSEIFFRRRHVRASYGASLIVHNNHKVFRAESMEISAGGCGVRIFNLDLQPGQTLFVHFKAGDEVPPFNAVGQIVSKQTGQPGQDFVKYGVKFTSINRQVQMIIKDFAEKAA